MNRVNINSEQLKFAMRNQNHKHIPMPYAQQGWFYAYYNSDRESKLLKCGQIYIQTQRTPVMPLAEERGKSYVIKELIMGEILAYKYFSNRTGEDFTADQPTAKIIRNATELQTWKCFTYIFNGQRM